MANARTVLETVKSEKVKVVELRFVDLQGRWRRIGCDLSIADEDMFENGLMLANTLSSDRRLFGGEHLLLVPDCNSATIDPFSRQKTLSLICDVVDPTTGQRSIDCPRGIAKAAEKYMTSSGVGDVAYFGPEPKFFLFDEIAYELNHYANSYGVSPSAPGEVDDMRDIRAEMVSIMNEVRLDPENQQHRGGSLNHIGFKFSTLTNAADRLMLYKDVVRQVAAAHGKEACFMPKPVIGETGAGMPVHQSLWKGGKPLFAGSNYADLSDMCLYYIGGIVKHAKTLNAFTNPSTNSYKRLVPNPESPVLLAYSSRNRSAACEIPFAISPKAKRLNIRFPDAGANPYLAFAAMLMAGLDGIQNKIHPGDPMDKDLYHLSPEQLREIPTVCGSLRQALEYLDLDRAFLKKGGVFSDGFIDRYIELKMTEVYRLEHTPHPVEMQMYHDV